MVVALAHSSSHYSTPSPKLNTVIIDSVGGNKDNQGALRILNLSLLGNGCPRIYGGILTMLWEKN